MKSPKNSVLKRTNIFTKYFLVFALIFVVAFIALGTALMVLVNSYEINEKTNLLKENATALSENISEMLIVNDMNSSYSPDKALICDSLRTVSNCIDADVFVCDVGGNVIICKIGRAHV